MARPNLKQADLMLKLYDLRREPEMRRARAYMMTDFNATSWDEVRPHYMSGDDMDRHFRMATTYWEMVASFVNRGLIDEELFFDTQGEGLFIWLKVRAIVPDGRKQIRPTWLWNLERMARRQLAWRERTNATAAEVIEAGSQLKAPKPERKTREADSRKKRTR
jgi:hypothetical protein